jgi:hypothetical protein
MRTALSAAALLAVCALPASAAAAPPTATAITVTERPGLVRAAIAFTGERFLLGEIVASDPDPFVDGEVRLPLRHTGVRTVAQPASAEGITVAIAQQANRITIRLAGAPRRFKYVHYRTTGDPQRLLVDLYESAPPAPAAEIRVGAGRCLTLRRGRIEGRQLRARGRERQLFEHALAVTLRGADGRVKAQRAVQAARGRWRARFRIPALPAQQGTLEAVAFSAKDGTLDCLVQKRVAFGT